MGRGHTQGKDAQRVESRTDVRLALEPSQKTLSGKILGKKKEVMIFTAPLSVSFYSKGSRKTDIICFNR